MVLNFLVIREAPSFEAFYSSLGRCQAVEQTQYKYHFSFPGHFISSSMLWLPFFLLFFLNCYYFGIIMSSLFLLLFLA